MKDGTGAIDAERDAGSDGAVECVLADGACPDGCGELKGTPVDPSGCPLDPAVIGCAAPDAAFDDAIGCYVNLETGTIYWTPQLYDLAGFRECSESERHRGCEDLSEACELRADGTCPEGCGPLTGWPLDEARGCLGESETIGCIEEGSSFPGAIGCQVEIESGKVYATPALYPMQPGYRQCDEAEQSASVSVPHCE